MHSTRIEELSNELIVSIFDYLDGCEMYESFGNLNSRFQSLINTCRPFQVNIRSTHELIVEHCCNKIINRNKSRITSLHLLNTTATKIFLKFVTITSSFDQLQSLTISGIVEHKLQSILKNLYFLPKMSSLNVSMIGEYQSIDTIYKSLFRLRSLKYVTLSYGPWQIPFSLRPAKKHRQNSIEYISIDLMTTFNELMILLSYMPNLRRLTCSQLFSSEGCISLENLHHLPRLTHVNFSRCHLQVPEFELFVKIVGQQLKVLQFSAYDNASFFDAGFWQKLIVKSMPNLKCFKYEHDEQIPNVLRLFPWHQQINRFKSVFWVKRQWCFDIHIDASPFYNNRITYSIHPYKKKWYHMTNDVDNEGHNHNLINSQNTQHHSILYSNDIELIATNRCAIEQYQVFIDNIKALFELVQISCLTIDLRYANVDVFVNLLFHLHNLDALSVAGLSLSTSTISSESLSKFQTIVKRNKIRKVCLKEYDDFQQIQFIVKLCPRVEFLQIECQTTTNISLLLQFILMIRAHQFLAHMRLLCIHAVKNDEMVIQQLEHMIHVEKLQHEFSLKRILDKIYVKWS